MILVCGEALIDLVGFSGDFDDLVLHAIPGGSPFNLAIGLARLEEEVAFAGGISIDRFGRLLLSRLTIEGVDTRWVNTSENPTALAVADVTSDGRIAYRFYTDKCAHFDVAPIVIDESQNVRALAIGSFLLDDFFTGHAVVQLAESMIDSVISFDPNVRPGTIVNRADYAGRVERILDMATIVKVSDEDLDALYGSAIPALEFAERLLARGAALVAATFGADGAILLHRSGQIPIPAIPVNVIDTVGAGDAFHAALLGGLSRRGLLERAKIEDLDAVTLRAIGREASIAAALTCARRGAAPPNLSELKSVNEQH